MSSASMVKAPLPPNAPGVRPASGPSAAPSGAMAMSTIDPVRILKKYKWLLAGAVVAGAVLGFVAHQVLLRVYPLWTSASIFQIEPPRDEVGRPSEARAVEQEELKRFIATQVEIMTSQDVLQRVAQRLNQNASLVPKWRQQYEKGGVFQETDAMVALEKIVSARAIAGTDLVQLSVTWHDPTEATALAELMRREYLARTQAQDQRQMTEIKATLDAQINDITTRVTTLQADRDRLVRGEGGTGDVREAMESIDTRYNEAAQTMQIVTAQLQQTIQQMDLYGVQQAQMQAAKEAPGGINYPDRIRQLVETNPLVANARQMIDAINNEIRVLEDRGVGESHPDMRNMRVRLGAAQQNLNDIRERELLSTFNAQLDEIQTMIVSFQQSQQRLESQRDELSLRLQDLLSASRKIVDLEQQIERLIETRNEKQTLLEDINAYIRANTRSPDTGVGRVRVLAAERKPDKMTFPQLRLIGPAGVVFVVGLTGGILVLREILDQRVKSPSDVGLIPRTRVVGIVPLASDDPTGPKKMETAFRDKPKGVVAEYFRQVRAPLAKRMAQTDIKSVVLVPGMPGSGATSMVTNLGFAMAALEKRTLLIDGNFRRPALHKVFELPEGPGLGEVLGGKATLDEAVRPGGVPNLSVLTVGGPDDRVYERLAGEQMARLMAEAKGKFDVILVDTAPAMVASDGAALAAHCDASILVVRAMAEKRGLVARLRNELADTRGEFLGVLVNAVRSAAGGYMRKNIQATHGYQSAA